MQFYEKFDRGGQVYYLYNKVDTIEQKVSELKELVPEATIGYVQWLEMSGDPIRKYSLCLCERVSMIL